MASEFVLMRPWEAKVYRVYDRLIDAVVGIGDPFRGFYIRVREAIGRQFEHYLAPDGSIRLRLNTGPAGLYGRINGKLVKIAQGTTVVCDDMSIIGWKECNSGRFDEDLGVPVNSKQEYRKLMKEKGLVPLESAKYCGSNEYRRKQRERYEAEKNRPRVERAFVEAVKQHGGGLNDG